MHPSKSGFKFTKESYWSRRKLGLSGTMPAPGTKQAKKESKLWQENAMRTPEWREFKKKADGVK